MAPPQEARRRTWHLASEPGSSFDLREHKLHDETLVCDSGPLTERLTLLGAGRSAGTTFRSPTRFRTTENPWPAPPHGDAPCRGCFMTRSDPPD